MLEKRAVIDPDITPVVEELDTSTPTCCKHTKTKEDKIDNLDNDLLKTASDSLQNSLKDNFLHNKSRCAYEDCAE